MSEIDVDESWDRLLAVVPGFAPTLTAYRASSSSPVPALCNELGELADYVVDRINAGELGNLAALFKVAEQLLVGGTEYVKTTIATCFLENLQNASSEDVARAWAPLLGDASRACCKAWDEFTGVQTPGL